MQLLILTTLVSNHCYQVLCDRSDVAAVVRNTVRALDVARVGTS